MPRHNQIDEDLIDKVVSSSLGRVGVVTGEEDIKFPDMAEPVRFWVGFGLDGKGTWCTRKGEPTLILAETLEEYRKLVRSRPHNVSYASPAVIVTN